MLRIAFAVAAAVAIAGCGSLETKAALVNVGDTKEAVLDRMGAPIDRQTYGQMEAWQYCQTGAGFGYHDYRIVWFDAGIVSGLNSYKSTRPGTSCQADLQQVRWEEAPDATVEVRAR
jgi:hypothetical protein